MIHDFSTPKGLSSVSHIISLLGSSILAKILSRLAQKLDDFCPQNKLDFVHCTVFSDCGCIF